MTIMINTGSLLHMSEEKHHPYQDLPAKNFWRTAIGEPASFRKVDLWTPKFPISKEMGLITMGSCFAQHLSACLRKEGFQWIDSEPAPEGTSEELAKDNGYGVFSFRTGNIYTPALLKQWIDWSLSLSTPSTAYILEDNRYYDPFRPAIPAQGFTTKEELFDSRTRTLSAIGRALRDGEIFIFTLGLTEAWRNTDGFVYPVCPGTIKGFSVPGYDFFHNYSYEEILADLKSVIAAVRTVNPDMKFLLTVSPVPLTATATDEHVLAATTYSKSVLRAVAGALASTLSGVDYFASYELISSPPFKGQFFERNLRSVTPAGVDFVMSTFLSGLERTERASPAVPQAPKWGECPGTTQDEVICEDALLESWNKVGNETAAAAKLLLVGDSHIAYLSVALNELGVPHVGGGILTGEQWHQLCFVFDEKRCFLPTIGQAREKWEESARLFYDEDNAAPESKVIITDIGMHEHMLTNEKYGSGFYSFLKSLYGEAGPAAGARNDDVLRYILNCRRHHLEILQRLVAKGHKVIFVTDPPFYQPELGNFFSACEGVLLSYAASMGCEVFHARQWFTTLPEPREQYMDGGLCAHGSPLYYTRLAEALLPIVERLSGQVLSPAN